MILLLNGDKTELPQGSTISDLLVLYGRSDSGVAVAVNLDVVPRQSFQTHELKEGDRVDIVTAVGGG